MGNIMNMVKLRNKPSRNGFDLSRKNLFTAKVGEMLPVATIECLPGDSFDIDTAWFTRTQPVNTAAYTRIREYYDWYFVPTNLLWNKFNTFVTQMVDNNQKATGINENVVLSDEQPYFTTQQLAQYVKRLRQADNRAGKKNIFGYQRSTLTCKLLHYLGYGDYSAYDTEGDTATYGPNYKLNPFKLLAFQKIYQDFVRDSQWEKAHAPSYNIDYMTGAKGTNNLPISEIDINSDNMFDMRYYNWNKDYFMGLLPNSQYGHVAYVDHYSNFVYDKDYPTPQVGQDITVRSVGDDGFINLTTPNSSVIKSGTQFSVLMLRQVEALQKWKEITQSQQQDYKSQIQAHFGEDVSEAYSDRCKYIGGIAGNLDIQPVQNQNLTGDNDANIAGRGEGGSRGTIKFHTSVHGYIVCIYHAVPLLEYALNGIRKDNLKTYVTDYAIPELDATGMVSVPLIELLNVNPDNNTLLGYAPRYYDYKLSFDEIHGAFFNGGLDSWVAPLDASYMFTYFNSRPNNKLDYTFFKVPPAVLNPIFGVDANSNVNTDQFLINCSFDIKAVRNLDRNGLPY